MNASIAGRRIAFARLSPPVNRPEEAGPGRHARTASIRPRPRASSSPIKGSLLNNRSADRDPHAGTGTEAGTGTGTGAEAGTETEAGTEAEAGTGGGGGPDTAGRASRGLSRN